MNAPPLIRPLRHIWPPRLMSQRVLARPVRRSLSTAQRRPNNTMISPAATRQTTWDGPTEQRRGISHARPNQQDAAAQEEDDTQEPRLPLAVSTLHLRPLRREVEWGVPTADLQLRSFHVRSLEFFCDFALRAAYYLRLPAFGAAPLPRITERWTVPRSHFIFKKSQENFERVTYRRLIQIRDGHPEAVQVWLAFLRKHQMAGVGMKANVWEFSPLDVGKRMDEAMPEFANLIDPKWRHLGESKKLGTVEKVEEVLQSGAFEQAKDDGPRKEGG